MDHGLKICSDVQTVYGYRRIRKRMDWLRLNRRCGKGLAQGCSVSLPFGRIKLQADQAQKYLSCVRRNHCPAKVVLGAYCIGCVGVWGRRRDGCNGKMGFEYISFLMSFFIPT